MYPLLFEIGSFPIFSYGIVSLIAALVAWALLPRYARRAGFGVERARTLFLVMVGVALAGGRLMHLAITLPQIEQDPRYALGILRSGGVWYGGVLACLAVGVWLARRWRVSFWSGLDMAAIPVIVAGGLGRIGCFLAGCCYGKPTPVPWAVAYTDPLAHRLHADLPAVPVHPVQLYEFAATLGLALALDRFGARPRPAGQVGLLWILAYGAIRSFLEVFRGDAERGLIAGVVSTSQVVGLASAAVAAVLLAARRSGHPQVRAEPPVRFGTTSRASLRRGPRRRGGGVYRGPSEAESPSAQRRR